MSGSEQNTLIILTGPTGIGKTRTGIELARHFNTEILSADSRQIYRELKTGTAVPSEEELQQVRHYFIQSHSIRENFNASRYEKEALILLKQLFRRHNKVFMVGGSMLYIDAVCRGIDDMPDADPELREKLNLRLEKEGLESLRRELKQRDPCYYREVDLKNPVRIIHALEISLLTGKPYSAFRSNQKKKRPFSILKIGLNCPRETLHSRINARVDKMMAEGLEEEARKIFPLKHLNALNTVGYRELFAWFRGEISKEKAIELIKRNTRRYARKQITWLRKDKEICWFEPNQTEEIKKMIET